MKRLLAAVFTSCTLVVTQTPSSPVKAEVTPLATTPSCNLLVAVDGARNGLLKIDTSGRSTEVSLGDFPFDVAASSDGRFAYVSGIGESVLYIVDLTTMTKVASIAVGLGPNGIEVSPDDAKVYVAVAGGVAVIDTTTRKLERTIELSDTPYDIALSPDGNILFTTMWFTATVERLDLTTSTTTRVTVPGNPGLVAISPDGNRMFVTHENNNQLTRIDTATMTATSINVGNKPRGIDISPDGRNVFFVDQVSKTLSIVDAATLSRRTIAVGDGAYDVTVDSTGTRAYVNNYWQNDVSVIELATSRVIGALPLGAKSESWNMETVCPTPTPFTRPGVVTDLTLFANFLCGPCTSGWVLFTRPAGATDFDVFIDGRRATCTLKGYFYNLSLCQLTALTPGRAMTLGVVPVNGSIRGRTASTSLTLRS